MKTAAVLREPVPVSRKASREHRRQQMIEATIESLASRGYAQTTMTRSTRATRAALWV